MLIAQSTCGKCGMCLPPCHDYFHSDYHLLPLLLLLLVQLLLLLLLLLLLPLLPHPLLLPSFFQCSHFYCFCFYYYYYYYRDYCNDGTTDYHYHRYHYDGDDYCRSPAFWKASVWLGC